MTWGIAPPRYRLPPGLRLGAAALQVSDLQRSLRYYQDVIGLQLLDSDAAAAVLGAHGDSRPLLRLHTEPGTRPLARSRRLGLYHFALLVPDRATLGRFARHLGGEGVRVSSADHAVSEAIYLWDPDGLGIEVYADRPRGGWKTSGGELFMTSEVLDVRGLIAAGGDEPWRGLPRGTVLGHMHLHVGDLGMAEAFYHRALGFDKTVWSYPGALFLSAGGYHHHLAANTWAAGAAPAAVDEARLLDWEVVLPSRRDVDAVTASCVAEGFPAEADAGGAQVSDPWGTRVRFTGDVQPAAL